MGDSVIARIEEEINGLYRDLSEYRREESSIGTATTVTYDNESVSWDGAGDYEQIYIEHDVKQDKVVIERIIGWTDVFPLEQLNIIGNDPAKRVMEEYKRFLEDLEDLRSAKRSLGLARRRLKIFPIIKLATLHDDVGNELEVSFLAFVIRGEFKKRPYYKEIELILGDWWDYWIDEDFLYLIEDWQDLCMDAWDVVNRYWGTE